MIIKSLTPDPRWQHRLEQSGFGYHTDNNTPYWIENYYFSISEDFANKIYHATNELWQMCLKAVEHVIENEDLDQFQLPLYFLEHIKNSWNEDTPTIYGRFDFAYDLKTNELKMLEFNADTPTSLFETGVIQWQWMQHYFQDSKDQFNSVHEVLIETWKGIKPHLKSDTLHFACIKDSLEDLTNLEYLRDCAIQAGIKTKMIYMDQIGWDNLNFTDLEDEIIHDIFKLYPWEWMVNEPFALHIVEDTAKANWIEPSWKILLSNKAILPVLWKLYPNHPLLLESYFDQPNGMVNYVKKPLFSREGANITLYQDSEIIQATAGEYGEEGYVCQQLAQLIQSKTGHVIIGSWLIGGESCGITFRESDALITTDKSRFIPHIIE